MFKRSGLVLAVITVAFILPGQVWAWGGFLTGTPTMGGNSAYGGGTKTIAATQSRSTFSAAGRQPYSFSVLPKPQTTFSTSPRMGTSFRAGFDILQQQPAVQQPSNYKMQSEIKGSAQAQSQAVVLPTLESVTQRIQGDTAGILKSIETQTKALRQEKMSEEEASQTSAAIATDISNKGQQQLKDVQTGVTQLLTTAETILKEDQAADKNVKLDYFSGSDIKLADKGLFKDIKFTDTREQIALPKDVNLEFTAREDLLKTEAPAVLTQKDGKLEFVGGINVKDMQFSGSQLDLKTGDLKSLSGKTFSLSNKVDTTQGAGATISAASGIALSKSDLIKIKGSVFSSPSEESKFSASLQDKGSQVGLKDMLTALNAAKPADNPFVLMHVENMDKFYKVYGGATGGSSRKFILIREKDSGYSYGITQTLSANNKVATAAAGVLAPQALADYWKTGYVFVPTKKASSKNLDIQQILDDPDLGATNVEL